MNCTEITTKLNEIKSKKRVFDNIYKSDIPRALSLKKELQKSIIQLKEMIKPVFKIEDKEFPVFQLKIGGKTAQELVRDLLSNSYYINDSAEVMINNSDFINSGKVEQINLVRLKVRDLGFANGATCKQIYDKAFKLGLALCPIEVGPYQRLNDSEQELDSGYLIASEKIIDENDSQSVLFLECDNNGLYLGYRWAGPNDKWDADNEVMFSLP